MRRKHQAKNTITKEFKTLISGTSIFRTGMGERLDQQIAIHETVPDISLERGKLFILRARNGQLIPSPMRP